MCGYVQLTAVQRQLVIEMLKSSNFSRLLSAVQECRSLLIYSSRRSSQMVESGAIPDMVGIEVGLGMLSRDWVLCRIVRMGLWVRRALGESGLHKRSRIIAPMTTMTIPHGLEGGKSRGMYTKGRIEHPVARA